jgi:hypothetical protein
LRTVIVDTMPRNSANWNHEHACGNLLSSGNTFALSHLDMKGAISELPGSILEMLGVIFKRFIRAFLVVCNAFEIGLAEDRRYVIEKRPDQHHRGIETAIAVTSIYLFAEPNQLAEIQVWIRAVS